MFKKFFNYMSKSFKYSKLEGILTFFVKCSFVLVVLLKMNSQFNTNAVYTEEKMEILLSNTYMSKEIFYDHGYSIDRGADEWCLFFQCRGHPIFFIEKSYGSDIIQLYDRSFDVISISGSMSESSCYDDEDIDSNIKNIKKIIEEDINMMYEEYVEKWG